MGKLIGEVMEELQATQVECSESNDFEKLQTVINGYQQLLLEAPHDPIIMFQIGTAHLQSLFQLQFLSIELHLIDPFDSYACLMARCA